MDLPILVLLLALLLAIAWLILIRRRGEPAESRPKSSLRPKADTKEYHSVSIILSENACAAAEKLSGSRILATTAPKLPLPECDVPECTCRFEHHRDRRVGRDRRDPFSPGIIGSGSDAADSELRNENDRRNNSKS